MGWLEGQVALVTGGGSGLGRAVVDRFVREGARVGVLDRSAEKLDKCKVDLGDEIVTIRGDVTSLVANRKAVAATVKRFGRLDTLVGNAGIWDYFSSLAATPDDALSKAFDELFAINVKGCLLGAKAALPALIESRGSIIFTVSNAGFDPGGGGPLYTASKFALRGLVTQLAYELAPKVRVNGVAPGALASDLRGPAALGMADMAISSVEGIDEMVKAVVPLGFLPTAEDYTGMYVLLAARDESRTITGTVLRGDGGIGVRGLGQTRGGDDL